MTLSARQLRQLSFLVFVTVALAAPERPNAAPHAPVRVPDSRALAPVFVANTGHTDSAARFVALGGAQPIFVTAHDVRIVDDRRQRSLWLTFVDGAAERVDGGTPSGGIVSYLAGAGATRHAAFRDVVYRRIWPGIDARITGVPGGIEYSFDVAAGADPGAIRLRYEGADRTTLDGKGELRLEAGDQTIVDRAPIAFQRVAGGQVPVDVRFVRHGDDIGFELGAYDATRPLVIDPTIVYSTYLGSSGSDEGRAIAVDANGAAYVAGVTRYSDFPTTAGAYQPTFRGGAGNLPSDAYVAKIDAAGTQFEYVTYLGGSGNDEAAGIAVDSSGNAYVSGFTESADFPVTSGAYRTTIGISHHDGFVTKLNASGSALVYSTFLGSSGSTDPAAIAVDASGFAYIVGSTWATNLPSTTNFAPWNTATGKRDGFLFKFSADGSNVVFGMPFGGLDEDLGVGVAVDGNGHAFVAGTTSSRYLTTTPGAVQRDPGSAAFKSTDGGGTWTLSNGVTHPKRVNAFAIDPQTPTTVYAGVEDSMLKSTDGGATWGFVNNGALNATVTEVSDVAVNPSAPGTVLAASASGIYRTVDGGGWWSRVHLFPVSRLAFAPSNPSIVYAGDGSGVLKSIDSGASWSRVLTASGSPVAVDPANANVVYFGTWDARIMKTSDGGATWAPLNLPPSNAPRVLAVAVDPLASSTVLAGVVGYGVFRSTDGGTSWTQVNSPVSYPERVVFDALDAGVVYAGDQNGGLGKSADHGASWQSVPVRGMYIAVRGLAARAGVVFAGTTAYSDAFVYRINTNAGTDYPYVYGTYLGGSSGDGASGIAIDSAGNAYVVIGSRSTDLPNTTGQAIKATAIVKLNGDASGILYSTFVGPTLYYQSGNGIAVDRNNTASVAGIYDDDDPRVWLEHVDANGFTIDRMFIDGTSSYTFPASDYARAIAVDAAGAVYLTGTTNTTNYPTTPGAPQPSYGSGSSDALVTKVSYASTPPPPPPSGTNVALNKPVVVSSVEAAQYAGANAVDRSLSTRWSSQFSDPQWIYVDLGQVYNITEVILRWETAFGADYSIDVSTDAVQWTTVRSSFAGDGGIDDWTGLSAAGRYVRMNGWRRGTSWGYSLWEFEVYGSPAPAPPSGLTNLALNRPVSTSSLEASQYAATNAVDGSLATRWSSEFSDPQWISIDLGKSYDISEVLLRWETAYASAYSIQVSDDATNWTTIRSVANGDGGVDDLTGLAGTGRFVRMYGQVRATQWGYSLWEFEVYGTAHTPPPPTDNVVIYASDVPSASLHGAWSKASDPTAAAGTTLTPPDSGVSNTSAPLANPTDYFDVVFNAPSGSAYTIWFRMKAAANSKLNDSVWVQFTDASIDGGAVVYQIGSTSGLLVNLATDSTASSLAGWGWQNTAYWLSQSTRLTFVSLTNVHTIRIQTREDGVQIDQIVLSPVQYASSPPGPATNDSTIVPKP